MAEALAKPAPPPSLSDADLAKQINDYLKEGVNTLR
jgi:hypothetical protein